MPRHKCHVYDTNKPPYLRRHDAHLTSLSWHAFALSSHCSHNEGSFFLRSHTEVHWGEFFKTDNRTEGTYSSKFQMLFINLRLCEWKLFKSSTTEVKIWHIMAYSDVIWHLRIWRTLAQVFACCLTAPSHGLDQCCQPPGSLHVLGSFVSFSPRRVSFKLIRNGLHERFIIGTYSDEIYEYDFRVFAIWGAHAFPLKIYCGLTRAMLCIDVHNICVHHVASI